LYYNEELNLEYFSLGADEILPFKGFSSGESITEYHGEGYQQQ
jgi:hypothetical protein